MTKKAPKGFDMGDAEAAFIKGAGQTPAPVAIGDAQLATQLNATQQAATQQRYPWQGADPRVNHNYTLGYPDRLALKLDKLKELKGISKRSVMLAGAEKEADRLLIELGIPPGEL